MKAEYIKIVSNDDFLKRGMLCYGEMFPNTIISYSITTRKIVVGRYARAEDYVFFDKIPSDVVVVRLNNHFSGVAVFPRGDNLLLFSVSLPVRWESELMSAGLACFSRALKWNNVISMREQQRINSNDLVFEKDGKTKKFTSAYQFKSRDKTQIIWQAMLTLGFDEGTRGLMRSIYKLDTSKMKRRGNVADIFDIVGGVREVNPALTIDKLASDVVSAFAKRFDLSIDGRAFTDSELLKANEIADVMKNKGWINEGIIPSSVTDSDLMWILNKRARREA